MPRLKLLSDSQQKRFESAPKFRHKQRERYFELEERCHEYLDSIRSPLKQIGFMMQLAYFRASGKFFSSEHFRKVDIRYAGNLLSISSQTLSHLEWSKYDRQTVAKHRQYIRKFYGWVKFNQKHKQDLTTELTLHAKQHSYPEQLLPIAARYLANRKIETPKYSTLQGIISEIYNSMEKGLVLVIQKILSSNQQSVLDDLIWIDDKRKKSYKYSALSRIKHLPTSTKVKDIEESVANYKLLKTFYVEFSQVYQQLGAFPFCR